MLLEEDVVMKKVEEIGRPPRPPRETPPPSLPVQPGQQCQADDEPPLFPISPPPMPWPRVFPSL
jgi:hypothetical protein